MKAVKFTIYSILNNRSNLEYTFLSNDLEKENFMLQDLSFRRAQNRSSRRICSVKKDVLKNLANFTGNHQCWSLILIKMQGFKPQHRHFPVKFDKFLKTSLMYYFKQFSTWKSALYQLHSFFIRTRKFCSYFFSFLRLKYS